MCVSRGRWPRRCWGLCLWVAPSSLLGIPSYYTYSTLWLPHALRVRNFIFLEGEIKLSALENPMLCMLPRTCRRLNSGLLCCRISSSIDGRRQVSPFSCHLQASALGRQRTWWRPSLLSALWNTLLEKPRTTISSQLRSCEASLTYGEPHNSSIERPKFMAKSQLQVMRDVDEELWAPVSFWPTSRPKSATIELCHQSSVVWVVCKVLHICTSNAVITWGLWYMQMASWWALPTLIHQCNSRRWWQIRYRSFWQHVPVWN